LEFFNTLLTTALIADLKAPEAAKLERWRLYLVRAGGYGTGW